MICKTRTVPESSVQVIGITGGSCSGKGYLCRQLLEVLSPSNCVVIPIDLYYRDLSHISLHERRTQNFDHPDAIDRELFFEHLQNLIVGDEVELPAYNFKTHTRSNCSGKISAKDKIIIIEGLFALYWEEVRNLLSFKIFIKLEWEKCLHRRIERDVRERGRTQESVVKQFHQTVLPMYESFVASTCHYADLVLSGDSAISDMATKVIEAITENETRLNKEKT